MSRQRRKHKQAVIRSKSRRGYRKDMYAYRLRAGYWGPRLPLLALHWGLFHYYASSFTHTGPAPRRSLLMYTGYTRCGKTIYIGMDKNLTPDEVVDASV